MNIAHIFVALLIDVIALIIATVVVQTWMYICLKRHHYEVWQSNGQPMTFINLVANNY